MSQAIIKIDIDNAAFGRYPEFEISRTLLRLAYSVQHNYSRYIPLMDVNGNKVGEFNIVIDYT